MRRFAFLLLVVRAALSQPADLDAWVQRSMDTFDVPGVAVGIVKDGKVLVTKGYGVRKLGDPARVDEHTLFGIASNTKAFTAAAVGILVDEHKAAWDDPVQKHLPSFQVYDPYVSRELTIRDLLSHRSGLGLGAGDLLFWPDTDVTRAQVLAGARHIRPASSLRSRYAYNNLAFVVAGEVVHSASGKEWDDFVRDRIFAPLGMAETRISGWEGSNVAVPHSRGWRLEGTLTPIQPTQDRTWAAAAGIRSSVNDLTKWMLAQLSVGTPEGSKQIWSKAVAEQMWAPQTVLPISDPPPALKSTKPNFSAYGLGWSLRDYKGRKIVNHGGALTGMVSMTFLVPQERLGIVVLTNQEESGAMSAIVYHVLDHYFGLPATDWISATKQAGDTRLKRAREAEQKLDQERAKDSRPSLALDKYAGGYEDPWYGQAILSVADGRLVLRMSRTPAMVADLGHWQHDTFRAVFRDKTIPDAFVTFALDPRGRVDQMKMEAVSSIADFSFDYHDLLFKPVRADSGTR
jgi:CubicO group peptidase (beta-lactamase class C family)